MEAVGLYYGSYRAKVIKRDDPEGLGRIMVHCEQVHGEDYPKVWAWPKAPFGGGSNGFWCIPDVGSYVYVEFDHGRLDKPIWHGGWWGDSDVTTDMTPDKVVIAVKEGMKVVMDRKAQTLLLFQDEQNFVELTPDFTKVSHTTKVVIESEAAQVTTLGDTTISAMGKVNIEGADSVNVISGGTVKIDGADYADISSTGVCNIIGVTALNLVSDGPVAITTMASVTLTAAVSFDVTSPVTNITSPLINLNGVVSASGAIMAGGGIMGGAAGAPVPGGMKITGPVTADSVSTPSLSVGNVDFLQHKHTSATPGSPTSTPIQ